jgi:ankyrin repeat protein
MYEQRLQEMWVMKMKKITLIAALMITFATHAAAECRNLCDADWWRVGKTTVDIQDELDAGAEVNATTKYGATPLHFAALSHAPANIQFLLDGGANVNASTEDGHTPLHSAAMLGTPASIQILLNAGAKVNSPTDGGHTPLHSAAMLGTPASIQILLNAGADAKAKSDEDKTPWNFAQENKQLKGTDAYWVLKYAQYK